MNIHKYDEYKQFIEDCRNTIYDETLVLHSHHIIPKHMWCSEGNVNSKDNLVDVSVEDHIKAHLMLAGCYEDGSPESNSNLRSARFLNKESIINKSDMDKIAQTYLGEQNPFYGKTHTDDVKKLLSSLTKVQCKGVSYDERYGERAQIEKDKRKAKVSEYHNTLTLEQRKVRSENISKSLKGKYSGFNNPSSKSVMIGGVLYGSIAEACRVLETNRYALFKAKLINKK